MADSDLQTHVHCSQFARGPFPEDVAFLSRGLVVTQCLQWLHVVRKFYELWSSLLCHQGYAHRCSYDLACAISAGVIGYALMAMRAYDEVA
jgi:hypothetical protein